MRNFFLKVQNALCRFMYGRNGNDQLNTALLVLYLVLWVLHILLVSITKSQLLSNLLTALMVITAVLLLWRTFSKKLDKRRAENARFLQWWNPLRSRFAGAKQRRADKTHKYFTCKNCGTICRVPTGKGRIEITCPKCGGKIAGKS